MNPTCETCRYFDGTSLLCRRNAPEWPSTTKNDWCGEHEPDTMAVQAMESPIPPRFRKPFKVGADDCDWFYAVVPRMCMGVREWKPFGGKYHMEIGRHRGWLIRRKTWTGETWYQLPEELKQFWMEGEKLTKDGE